MHRLCVSALVIACCSCGGERPRSAEARRGGGADRESAAETLGAKLAGTGVIVPQDREVTLREVIASRSIVGRRVRVVGRCALPLGVPDLPARRSDVFQIEADGITVLVVGARPAECSPRSPAPLTLIVVVAEDTLAAIGDLPTVPRRYLVRVEGK